jgi:hypothetical protein
MIIRVDQIWLLKKSEYREVSQKGYERKKVSFLAKLALLQKTRIFFSQKPTPINSDSSIQ